MIISGLQKLTLIDYPSKVACVVFTLGCNLRCRFCHNPEFVLPEKIRAIQDQILREKSFFDFLESRRGLLDGVSVCGGEPTIHSDLPRFLREIKKRGFLVKLDTNGRYPLVLQKILDEKLVDYIAMDIKHTWGKYHLLTGVTEDTASYRESIKIIMIQAPEYEFRTTMIRGIHTIGDIQAMAKQLRGAKKYVLQNYRSGEVLECDFPGTSFSISELVHLQSIVKEEVMDCTIRQ